MEIIYFSRHEHIKAKVPPYKTNIIKVICYVNMVFYFNSDWSMKEKYLKLQSRACKSAYIFYMELD